MLKMECGNKRFPLKTKKKTKVYQNVVCWINLNSAQERERTDTLANEFSTTVSADCLEKGVNSKTGDILYQVHAVLSPRRLERRLRSGSCEAESCVPSNEVTSVIFLS